MGHNRSGGREVKVGYKVVLVGKGRYFSAIKEIATSQFGVEYKIGEWVKPNFAISPLFVFNDGYEAVDLARYESCVVFRCFYVPSENKKSIILYPDMVGDYGTQFWIGSFNNSSKQTFTIPHTVFADEVMLTERVDN